MNTVNARLLRGGVVHFISDFGTSLVSVQVIQFVDELLALDINEKIIISLQFREGRFTPLAAIELPGHHHGNKSFQVIGDVAALFQVEANKICILYKAVTLFQVDQNITYVKFNIRD